MVKSAYRIAWSKKIKNKLSCGVMVYEKYNLFKRHNRLWKILWSLKDPPKTTTHPMLQCLVTDNVISHINPDLISHL